MSTLAPSMDLEALHQAMHACTRCSALVGSRSRVVPGAGNPKARIMFVGEAPGEKEDQQGIPFVGAAGKLLDELLKQIGLDRRDVFITNVVKCRPEGNRDPDPTEVHECKEHLYAQLLLINPAVICTLGRWALNTLVSPDMKISDVHGKAINKRGLVFFPIFHPAAALHQPSMREDLLNDFLALKAYLVKEGEL